MKFGDYHVHSIYSDGTDDIESIIEFAAEKGLKEIGISDHSYTFFDESYCIQKENGQKYVEEITLLKKKYEGKIKVLCGIEFDAFSDIDLSLYDYAIGSVHYFKKGDKYYPIDGGRKYFEKAVNEIFLGDYYAAAEEYYKTVSEFSNNEKIKIIGHFDIIAKYNGKGEYFDEKNERYVNAYFDAAKRLISKNKTFEINTSPLRKRLRSDAYPFADIRKVIKDLGGKFILSSDSHRKEDIAYGFELFEKEL